MLSEFSRIYANKRDNKIVVFKTLCGFDHHSEVFELKLSIWKMHLSNKGITFCFALNKVKTVLTL